MATSGHRRAAPIARKRRRSTLTRTLIPGLGLAAVLGSAVAVVVHDDPAASRADAVAAAEQLPADVETLVVADPPTRVSRSAERVPLPDESAVQADISGTLFAVKDLTIFANSDRESAKLATVEKGDTVDVTGETKDGWTQVIHKDLPRWVVTTSVAKQMPKPPPPPEPTLSDAPCAAGAGPESGLQPDTIKVYRAVCAEFPEVTTYGGTGGGGEHATGQALDIMISSDTGTALAEFLMKNRAELGIEYLIWRQQIWRPATSSAWRPMSDRGSPTANHFDHVHVTTYGTSATG